MKITKLPGQIAEFVLSIVGIRIGTEEPHYISAPLTDHVELRKYGPRIAAETTVAADEARAGHRVPAPGQLHLRRQPPQSRDLHDRTGRPAVRRRRHRDDGSCRPITDVRQPLDDPILHAVQVDDGHASGARRRQRRVGDRAGRDGGGAAVQRRPQLSRRRG
jgi:hypothetical protein